MGFTDGVLHPLSLRVLFLVTTGLMSTADVICLAPSQRAQHCRARPVQRAQRLPAHLQPPRRQRPRRPAGAQEHAAPLARYSRGQRGRREALDDGLGHAEHGAAAAEGVGRRGRRAEQAHEPPGTRTPCDTQVAYVRTGHLGCVNPDFSKL